LLTGQINSELEAVVRVWIGGPEGRSIEIEATVDTGFSGSFSLPWKLVSELGLLPQGRMLGTLADGTRNYYPLYRAIILWHGRPQLVYVSAVDSDPLLGMGMLHGSELAMQVVVGGEVYIREMQPS